MVSSVASAEAISWWGRRGVSASLIMYMCGMGYLDGEHALVSNFEQGRKDEEAMIGRRRRVKLVEM